MTIPFLDVFKRATAFLRSSAAAPKTQEPEPSVVTVEKPNNERLSKTVMPNKLRGIAPSYMSGGAAVPNTRLSEARGAGKRDLPPAVALALQAQTERAISLQLSELLDQVPSGFLQPEGTFDTSRTVLLKASEIEKGMSVAKPTVSLATIYEQVPEIFLQSLPPDDLTQVALPYQRVLEQFSSVKVREDQEKDAEIPQVETPFLKVAVEDTKRFGTPMPSLQSSPAPVKVEPATAKTISSAVPEAVARETAPAAKQRVQLKPGVVALTTSVPPPSAPVTPPAASAAPAQSGAPTRIPFHLPPNGTGASTTERVPASGGPSVPTSSPQPSVPARIPFKLASSSPTDPTKPKLTLVPGVQPPEQAEPEETVATPAKMETPSSPAPKPALSPAPAPQAEPAAAPNKSPSIAAAPTAAHETKSSPSKVEMPGVAAKASVVPIKLEAPVKAANTVAPAAPVRVQVPPAAAKPERAAAPAPAAASMISLSVRAVLLNVPVFQFAGDAETIPADLRMELPLALIQGQLAAGKVAVPPKMFQAALPEPHRSKFACDDVDTPVLLPLQEVLTNLPASALKMREDQEKPAALPQIETPFSIKAAEDASKKLTTGPVPAAQTVAAGNAALPIAQPAAAKAEPGKPQPATAKPLALETVAAKEPVPHKQSVIAQEAVLSKETGKTDLPKLESAIAKPAPVQPPAAKEIAMTKETVVATEPAVPKEPVAKPAQESPISSAAAKPGPTSPKIAERPMPANPVTAPFSLKSEAPKPTETAASSKPGPAPFALKLQAPRPTETDAPAKAAAPVPERVVPDAKKTEPAAETKTPILKLPPLIQPTAAQKTEIKPEPKASALLRPTVPGTFTPAPGKTETKSSAKEVVEKAKSLAGVAGCSVTFSDGLSLAGNMPNEVALEGLCAVAPSLLKKIDRHMVDSKLGSLTSMTLHSEKSPVTFFVNGEVCLTVLHAGGELANETQDQLWEMAKELSRFYSEPETAHVDH